MRVSVCAHTRVLTQAPSAGVNAACAQRTRQEPPSRGSRDGTGWDTLPWAGQEEPGLPGVEVPAQPG